MNSLLLVAGLGRCGTSLVMGMLDAGGYPVECDPDCRGNSYESPVYFDGLNEQPANPDSLAWVRAAAAAGKAVKWLDPHRHPIPEDVRPGAKAIWLTRDPRQQATSQWKFVCTMMPGTARSYKANVVIKDFMQQNVRYEPLARAVLPDAVLHLTFEQVLAHPVECATKMAALVGRPLDLDRMAARVRRRDPRCAPDMTIEATLLERSV